MNEALAISVDTPSSMPLDLDSLGRWVCSPDRITEDGRVFSWSNPEHPGYPYDEATALFAHLFRWQGDMTRSKTCTDRVRVGLGSGWLGRDGVAYVFDTALALPLVDDSAAVRRVVAALTARKPCDPVTRPDHWSQLPGPHLLKCSFWLARVGELSLAGQLADELMGHCFEKGRFRIRAGSEVTYLHSHCYALEGLLGLSAWLRSKGLPVPQSYGRVLTAGADWLVDVQHADGGLPDYVGQSSICRPSDVLAQAVRLWVSLDPVAYRHPIEAALQQLAARQNPASGGIVYHDDSLDECSWVAAFALQAGAWALTPPQPEEILWLI